MSKVYEKMMLSLVEAKKLMMEGPKYGGSPTQTGRFVGQAMAKIYKTAQQNPSHEDAQRTIKKKEAQVKKIADKVAKRQVRNVAARTSAADIGITPNNSPEEVDSKVNQANKQVYKAAQGRFNRSYPLGYMFGPKTEARTKLESCLSEEINKVYEKITLMLFEASKKAKKAKKAKKGKGVTLDQEGVKLNQDRTPEEIEARQAQKASDAQVRAIGRQRQARKAKEAAALKARKNKPRKKGNPVIRADVEKLARRGERGESGSRGEIDATDPKLHRNKFPGKAPGSK